MNTYTHHLDLTVVDILTQFFIHLLLLLKYFKVNYIKTTKYFKTTIYF